MAKEKVIRDENKVLFRSCAVNQATVDTSRFKAMVEFFRSEMKREWDDSEKVVWFSKGNDKTHLYSYSTMPGLDCIQPDGSFPPCFTSGVCYALKDIMYNDVRIKAAHNSALIRKYPDAFKRSLREVMLAGENIAPMSDEDMLAHLIRVYGKKKIMELVA